ncbi:MAG: toll/interleukin-1 receptor domain-containing protein [Proteobacteria bacterium]|nr:toll/interleukin-1 receptor domain-containing protein [Pseudomonadota bacterium]MBP6107336.1 toll/interleukin-1 receptor domain-containing protein [Steroidobacteraceae bacterium]MBP7015310.1 toll/interleukin-1 receptor domain-containing protein [Steroidobacteraceae bacterium]
MSHVFISYARSTARQAQQVAAVLRDLGHDVWLDDAIPAHRAYADVIEERLREARAVDALRPGPVRRPCRLAGRSCGHRMEEGGRERSRIAGGSDPDP